MSTTFNVTRTNKVGPTLWLFCFQFMILEYWVSLHCPFPYSRLQNYISDLGSVHCSTLSTGFHTAARTVCSPLHAVMNTSFIVEGVLISAGALFMRKLLPPGKMVGVATVLFVIGGIGAVVAGLAPNDVNLRVHFMGALLILFGGSVGMMMVGIATLAQAVSSRLFGAYTLASGLTALAGTVLTFRGITLGLGIGSIERVGFYPLPIWLAITGIAYLKLKRLES